MTSKQPKPRASSNAPVRKSAADREKAIQAIRKSGGQGRKVNGANRKIWLRVVGPIGVIVLLVVVLVVVKVSTNGSHSGPAATAASSDVINGVTGVPASTFDAVGAGAVKTPPSAIQAPALTADGKPRVLYIGAEYCPYCAAERWSVVAALSRFGSFSNLGQTASSAQDVFPSTPTLTFHGASYTSTLLSFTGVETTSNEVVNGKYAPLDTLSAADQQLMQTYNSQGSIPFVDIGGRYVSIGASYDPGVLQGKTHAEIAKALSDPNSAIAKAVDGSANVITAALCQLTSNAPAAVCTSSGVTAAKAKLG